MHTHAIPTNIDISGDTNLAVTPPITLTGDTIGWDATLTDDIMWSDGAQASITHTFAVTGTDPTFTFSDGLTVITGGLTVDTDTFVVDSVNNAVGINTATPLNALHIEGSLGDVATDIPIRLVRNSEGTNFAASSMLGIATTTGNMGENFGIRYLFGLEDATSTGDLYGAFGCVRGTSDGRGRLIFQTSANGLDPTTKMVVEYDGKILMGDVQNTDMQQARLVVETHTDGHAIAIEELGGNERWALGVNTNGDLGFFDSINTTPDVVMQDGTGFLGLGELAPETVLEITHTTPYLTLHNSTEENGDGGRESRINFKGEQDGTEETTLARIEVSHDGAADDQKGKIVFSVNDGDDGDTPTTVLTMFADSSIVMTGDTYWTGDGSGLPYSHMYVDGTQVIRVALTLNTPAEIKGDGTGGTAAAEDGWLAGDLNMVTFPTGGTEHYLTVTKAGVYQISWNVSFTMVTGAANTQIHAGLAVDGTPIRNKCEGHRTISNNTDTGNMSGSCKVDLPNGTEELSLWMENTTNSNDANVSHGSLTADMAGGT